MPVSVTISLSTLTGSALEGAHVSARLITPDFSTDGVVPKSFEDYGTTDAAGELVLSLYPNTLTSTTSYYRVRAWHPTTKVKVIDMAVCVPNHDCSLSDLERSSWPPIGAVCTAVSSFPGDTEYIFYPWSYMDVLGQSWHGWQTNGLLYRVVNGVPSLVPGGGITGLFWRLYSESGNMDAAENNWIPGMTETIYPLLSGTLPTQIITSYCHTAVGSTESSLIAAETVLIGAFTPYADAPISKFTHTDDGVTETCAETSYGSITVRNLPMFQISDGAGTIFNAYPSLMTVAAGTSVDSCIGTFNAPSFFCRAYPV